MNQPQASILVVEDDPSLRDALTETLQYAGHAVRACADGVEALAALHQGANISLIISDVQMPNLDGNGLLEQVKRQWPMIPMVLVTAFAQVSQAVNAIQNGASDYLVKPFEADHLLALVNRLIEAPTAECNVVGDDPATVQLLKLAQRVAQSEATVMISGESGTGKEVFAHYIHDCSQRAQGPFIAINCAAIPENMLEAVLFGYEKGAYTGAVQASAGKFEQANGGTILLDEISEMDLGLQAKLLRVLQERIVERLGSHKTIDLDVRVLATTNRDLMGAVKAGTFREDLFYRLNVFPLMIEPLRARPRDILPLAQHFLGQYASGEGVVLSEGAALKLGEHEWPGNVRELENVIQRALILKTGQMLTESDIHYERVAPLSAVDQDAALIVADQGLGSGLKDQERAMILDALELVRGSRKAAAEKLGISPRTLRYKLARFKEQGIALPC